VEQIEKLSRVLLHSIEILNFDINLERAAFGDIFSTPTSGGNFDVDIGRV
jgi:hypothetical protein